MLLISRDSGKQIYLQIYEYYRDRILSGQAQAHSSLPSTRHLARELSVSRNTVETAYQQLLAEGYLYSRPGSGYYISQVERLSPPTPKISFHAADDVAEEDRISVPGIKYNFQYGRLSPESFPLKTWKRIANKILLDVDPNRITAYTSRTGDPLLKEEITKYLYESRNVACEADRIVLCSGLLTVISLLCQLFMGKFSTVAVEDPCYDTVRHIFQNHGYKVCPIPLRPDGLDIDALRGSGARLIYITPSHQFPSGTVMSASKRIKLLQWAQEQDGYIIEDDYDSEYRYNSKPLPSLHSLDNRERVIYINTFSKSLAPMLRLGYMVLPPALKELYDFKFANYGCTVPLLTQLVLAEFMAAGHWQRHLRRIALSSKNLHDLLVNEIQNAMGSQAEIQGNNAGLHFLLAVHNGMDEEQLIASARQEGVLVYPVSQYFSAPPRKNNRVLIGFGGIEAQGIPESVHLLKKAWFQ